MHCIQSNSMAHYIGMSTTHKFQSHQINSSHIKHSDPSVNSNSTQYMIKRLKHDRGLKLFVV